MFRKEAEKQLQLEKLKLLSILSIPKKIPFVEHSPWKVELGFERSYSFQSRPETGKIFLQGGRGVPLSFSNYNLFGYALISPEVFWSKDHQWSLGPKSSLGIFMSPSLNTKLSLSSEWARYFNKTSILTSANANFSFSVRVERNWELRVELEKQNQRSEAKLRAISYF